MTTSEGLTREEREERAEYWRQRSIAKYEGDPEMQQLMREAKFDFEATPEENAEDIRIARERANSPTISLEEFFRWQAEEFPDEAEYILGDILDEL